MNNALPILLYSDDFSVCCRISDCVQRSAKNKAGVVTIINCAIGEDSLFLERINEKLESWNAYAIIHLVIVEGPM